MQPYCLFKLLLLSQFYQNPYRRFTFFVCGILSSRQYDLVVHNPLDKTDVTLTALFIFRCQENFKVASNKSYSIIINTRNVCFTYSSSVKESIIFILFENELLSCRSITIIIKKGDVIHLVTLGLEIHMHSSKGHMKLRLENRFPTEHLLYVTTIQHTTLLRFNQCCKYV
jgi:hypothetical protein